MHQEEDLSSLLERNNIWDAHENYQILLCDINTLHGAITYGLEYDEAALRKRLTFYERNLDMSGQLRTMLLRAKQCDRLGFACYMCCFCNAIKSLLDN
jgi:hypothetical protein